MIGIACPLNVLGGGTWNYEMFGVSTEFYRLKIPFYKHHGVLSQT